MDQASISHCVLNRHAAVLIHLQNITTNEKSLFLLIPEQPPVALVSYQSCLPRLLEDQTRLAQQDLQDHMLDCDTSL